MGNPESLCDLEKTENFCLLLGGGAGDMGYGQVVPPGERD